MGIWYKLCVLACVACNVSVFVQSPARALQKDGQEGHEDQGDEDQGNEVPQAQDGQEGHGVRRHW